MKTITYETNQTLDVQLGKGCLIAVAKVVE